MKISSSTRDRCGTIIHDDTTPTAQRVPPKLIEAVVVRRLVLCPRAAVGKIATLQYSACCFPRGMDGRFVRSLCFIIGGFATGKKTRQEKEKSNCRFDGVGYNQHEAKAALRRYLDDCLFGLSCQKVNGYTRPAIRLNFDNYYSLYFIIIFSSN